MNIKLIILILLISFKSYCQSENLKTTDSIKLIATLSYFKNETIRLKNLKPKQTNFEYWIYADNELDNNIITDGNNKIIYLTKYEASHKAIKENIPTKSYYFIQSRNVNDTIDIIFKYQTISTKKIKRCFKKHSIVTIGYDCDQMQFPYEEHVIYIFNKDNNRWENKSI